MPSPSTIRASAPQPRGVEIMAKKFTTDRACVQFGPSTYVCLDKRWGILPGDIVKITVELKERGVRSKEADKKTD